MKNFIITIIVPLLSVSLLAQKPHADIHEFDLANGLHVIIAPDSTSPIVNVGAMYHVGSKNERSDRTGFAHFFEHLLFHGTANIPEGMMENYMRMAGGYSNASTSADRTFYYTILPAHQLHLGLWIESERMLHPIISQKGIDREREVVKEESRQRYDIKPLGRVPEKMQAFEYQSYPYCWPVIGSMHDLNAASMNDFKSFFEKYYVPNNACLILTGGVDVDDAMKYVYAYFNRIPRGKDVIQPIYNESVQKPKIDSLQWKNIKNPHMVVTYKTVGETHPDANAIRFLIAYMNLYGSSPILSLKKDEQQKDSLRISNISTSDEIYEKAGSIWVRSSFDKRTDYHRVVDAVQKCFDDVAENGLPDNMLSKLRISFYGGYMDMYYDVNFLGEMLGTSYLFRSDASYVNKLPDIYRNITNADIKRVASQYFNSENRRILLFTPMEKNK